MKTGDTVDNGITLTKELGVDASTPKFTARVDGSMEPSKKLGHSMELPKSIARSLKKVKRFYLKLHE